MTTNNLAFIQNKNSSKAKKISCQISCHNSVDVSKTANFEKHLLQIKAAGSGLQKRNNLNLQSPQKWCAHTKERNLWFTHYCNPSLFRRQYPENKSGYYLQTRRVVDVSPALFGCVYRPLAVVFMNGQLVAIATYLSLEI